MAGCYHSWENDDIYDIDILQNNNIQEKNNILQNESTQLKEENTILLNTYNNLQLKKKLLKMNNELKIKIEDEKNEIKKIINN